MAGAEDTQLIEAAGLDRGRIEARLAETLDGADDGELFLEHKESESLVFDDGRLKNASFDTSQGFGFRCVAGEMTGYAHAAELSEYGIPDEEEKGYSARESSSASSFDVEALFSDL